jgi:hypothetical protein
MMDDSPQVHGSQEHWFSWRHSDLTPSTVRVVERAPGEEPDELDEP